MQRISSGGLIERLTEGRKQSRCAARSEADMGRVKEGNHTYADGSTEQHRETSERNRSFIVISVL